MRYMTDSYRKHQKKQAEKEILYTQTIRTDNRIYDWTSTVKKKTAAHSSPTSNTEILTTSGTTKKKADCSEDNSTHIVM